MTKEEKAKAYDEALERARKIKNGEGEWRYSDLNEIAPVLTEIFPQLAESEDERIREEIISAILSGRVYDVDLIGVGRIFQLDKEVADKWIAYLEKQKEQPTNEEMLRTLRTEYEKGVADTIAKYEQKEQTPVDYDHEMWKNCEANFEGGKKEVINNPEKYGLTKQRSTGWSEDEKDKLNSIERLIVNANAHGNYLIGDKEATDLQHFVRSIVKPTTKPAEWSDTDNIGWEEAFACATRAEKAAEDEGELQNAVTAEKWLKEIKFKYYVHPVKQEWSEEDGMETINVFRPLAGTSIENATKQAVNKFTNSGKKFLLAFNGVFLLIDNTKSVQDIVSEYNRSLGGKKKEQEQSEGEPNDFEITLNDCMLAAQQYPPGEIGWDDVKMWAEELSNYCPQPKQEWDEFDEDCLKRAIWYVENPAPSVVKDTNLVLWLKSLRPQPRWKPSEHQMNILKAVKDYVGKGSGYWGEALGSLIEDLEKL